MNNNLKDIEFSNTPLHHIWYRTNFNTVDKRNKLWYRFTYQYKVFNWKNVYLFALIKECIINAYVL